MIKNLLSFFKENPNEFLHFIYVIAIPSLLSFTKYIIDNLKELYISQKKQKGLLFSEIYELQTTLNIVIDNINLYINNQIVVDDHEFLKLKESYLNINDYHILLCNLNIHFNLIKLEEIAIKDFLLFRQEKIKNVILLQNLFDLYNGLIDSIDSYYMSEACLSKELNHNSDYFYINNIVDEQYKYYLSLHKKFNDFLEFLLNHNKNLQSLLDMIYETKNVDLLDKDKILNHLLNSPIYNKYNVPF